MSIRTRINGELCERVEDAGALRHMDVVYTQCDHCPGKWHRGALVRRYPGSLMVNEQGWLLLPVPGSHNPSANFVVSDSSVAVGYVWRVVDEDQERREAESARLSVHVMATGKAPDCRCVLTPLEDA